MMMFVNIIQYSRFWLYTLWTIKPELFLPWNAWIMQKCYQEIQEFFISAGYELRHLNVSLVNKFKCLMKPCDWLINWLTLVICWWRGNLSLRTGSFVAWAGKHYLGNYLWQILTSLRRRFELLIHCSHFCQQIISERSWKWWIVKCALGNIRKEQVSDIIFHVF